MALFKQSRDIIPSFDYIDLVSATGYVTYDGVNAYDSGGVNYILIDSSAIGGIGGVGSFDTSDTKSPFSTRTQTTLDMDFDLSPFQLPRTVEGTFIVSGNIIGSSNGSKNHTITAYIRKWDGSSETELGSASTASINVGINESKGFVLAIDVSRTNFKQGEQLRLTIAKSANEGGIAHNPNDSAISANSNYAAGIAGATRLTIQVPYKLDFL